MNAHRQNYAAELKHSLLDAAHLAIALGLGERMKRQPHGVIVCCPAHEERHPSCSIRIADDGTIAVKCFACDFSCDVLGLIAHVRGLNTRTEFRNVLVAAAEIAGRYDVLEALDGRSGAPTVVRTAPAKTVAPKPERDLVRERVVDALLSLDALASDPDGYLAGRGIAAYAEALGCRMLPAPAEQGAIVAELLTVASRDELERASVLEPGRDAIRWPEHRLLIPWRRRDGSVAALQRRWLRDETEGKYRAPMGAMVDLEPFGAHAFAVAAPTMPDADVVIVEGALDVAARMTLAMHAREHVLVIGAFSVSSHATHDWHPFVNGRRVRIALDADAAGEKNAPELAVAVMAAGAASVVRTRPRGANDWNGALCARRLAA